MIPVQQAIYYPPGTAATVYKPGDFFLSTNDSLFARIIKFGEGLHLPKEYCWTNHAGRVMDVEGNIIEALAHGLEVGNISKYTEKDCVVVSPAFTDAERAKVVQWSQRRYDEHEKYGFVAIGCASLMCLTKSRFRFGIAGQIYCSGYVAAGNAQGGEDMGDMPQWMMPAELAARYQVKRPGVGS